MAEKLKNVATGIVSGIAVGLIFIVFGGILCLTGIGALIGIPLMIAGTMSIFGGGAVMGLFIKNGKCPYCDSAIVWIPIQPGINCRACKKRIIFKDNVPTAIK